MTLENLKKRLEFETNPVQLQIIKDSIARREPPVQEEVKPVTKKKVKKNG